MKYLRTEFMKLRRRHLWLLFAADLGITFLWILYTLQDLDLSRLTGVTGMLGSNLLLINTILTPLLMAVAASRMCDMEQAGNTYSWIFTMQTPETFWNSKLAAGGIYLLFLDLLQTLFYAAVNQSFEPGWQIHYLEFFITIFWFICSCFSCSCSCPCILRISCCLCSSVSEVPSQVCFPGF